MLTTLNNCTFSIERLSPATGGWVSVISGISGYIEPATEWRTPGAAPFRLADGYEGKVTDRLLCPLETGAEGNDRVTVTPTGGGAKVYNARPPQNVHGWLAHQVVPLADYEPGAA